MKKAVFVFLFFGFFVGFYANAQISVDNVLHSIFVYCKKYDLVSSGQINSTTGNGVEFDYYKYINNDIAAIDNSINPDIFGLYFGCNSIEDAMNLLNNMENCFEKIGLAKTLIPPENINVFDTSLIEFQPYKYILTITITPIKVVMAIAPVNNTDEYNLISIGYRI
jgi:hypothetical protein